MTALINARGSRHVVVMLSYGYCLLADARQQISRYESIRAGPGRYDVTDRLNAAMHCLEQVPVSNA